MNKYMACAVCTVLAATALTTSSCKNNDKGSKATPVPVVRLDRSVAEYSHLDSLQRVAMLDSLRPEISALLQVLGADTCSYHTALTWSQSMAVDMFSPLADTVYKDLSGFEQTLGSILENAREQGISLPRRRYVAVVWGRPQSIVFNDSVVLIALNHYLGADSPAYANWPEYQRRLKTPRMLDYDMAEALVGTAFPYAPKNGNGDVLSRLLYEGAMAEAKMRLVPDAKPEDALGFTHEQLEDIKANRGLIWKRLVSGKMLYSADSELSEKLFGLMPFSTPLSNDAPGRSVRLIGYEIVKAYLDRNPETALSQLLTPAFYTNRDILRQSGYNPL